MLESAFEYLEFFYNQTFNKTLVRPWILENETLEVQEKINETIQWLSQKAEEQEKMPLYEDPVLKRNEIADKLEMIKTQFGDFITKPDPEEVG